MNGGIEGGVMTQAFGNVLEEGTVSPGKVVSEIVSGRQFRDEDISQKSVVVTGRSRQAP